MNKFYFTFGVGHIYRNYVQVIVAADMETASAKMFELFGKDWGIIYTEKQWIEVSPNHKIERKYVYCGEVMKSGEMFGWTNRLNNILEVDGPFKNKRLVSLISDLEHACDLVNDTFARSLFVTVNESLVGYGS